MLYVPTINHPGNTMQRSGIAVLGVLFALALIAVGFGLYSPGAEAIRANAAEARIQGLVNQLGDAQLTPARHLAQQHSEEAGPAAVDPLIAALHSPSATLRRNSAEMLGIIASPRGLDALSGVMATDTVPTVRSRAAWALGELNDVRIAAPLEHAAALDSNAQVRQEAEYSLTALQARLAVAAGKNESLVSAFAVAPRQTNIVYLAEFDQLSISRDGGKTWSTLAGTTPSRVVALAVSPVSPHVIYAGTESMGLYKSADGGATWSAMNQALGLEPGVRLGVTAIAVDPENPDRVYLARGAWVGTSHASFLPMGVMQSLSRSKFHSIGGVVA
jgi:HEAT repeats